MTDLTLALASQTPRSQTWAWSGTQDAATDDLQASIDLGGRLLTRCILHVVATGAAAAGSTGRLRVFGRPDLATPALEFEAASYRGLTYGYIGATGSTGLTYTFLTNGGGTNLWPTITSAVGTGVWQAGGLVEACFGGLINAGSSYQDGVPESRLASLRLDWRKGDLTAGLVFSRIAAILHFGEA